MRVETWDLGKILWTGFALLVILLILLFHGCGPYGAYDAVFVHSFGLFKNENLMIGTDGSGPSHLFYSNPDNDRFHNVCGSGAHNVFAVCSVPGRNDMGNTSIWHYDGSLWHALAGSKFSNYKNIYDVWLDAPDRVFFVGTCGEKVVNSRRISLSNVILHYDGSKWSETIFQTGGALMSVWINASDDVFVVGRNARILHYDGSSWSKMTVPVRQRYDLNDVWGSGPKNVFAVGGEPYGKSKCSAILHYNGDKWSEKSWTDRGPLNAVWGVTPDNVFAVGEGGLILRYNGSSWSQTAPPEGAERSDLKGVWASGPNDVFVVGSIPSIPRKKALILHYNGSTWSKMKVNLYGLLEDDVKWFSIELNGVWGNGPNDVFTVGSCGVILHYNGSSWSKMTTPFCSYQELNF